MTKNECTEKHTSFKFIGFKLWGGPVPDTPPPPRCLPELFPLLGAPLSALSRHVSSPLGPGPDRRTEPERNRAEPAGGLGSAAAHRVRDRGLG